MKGRKPKPVARHISEGDPSKFGVGRLQERLERQVQTTQGLPKCPRHLRGRARVAWNFWADELRDMGLACRPDAMMLEGACVNYAIAVQADLMLQREGITIEIPVLDEDGDETSQFRTMRHPAIAISNAAWRQVRSFCSEFGFSPVSRTRLAIEKPDTSMQDLMEALSRPRDRGAQPPRVQ